MIAGILHSGSGLGNQLHRYVATRVLALDKGYDFSMVAPENFKGKSFMNLDMGWKVGIPYTLEQPAGKIVPYHPDFKSWEEKTPYYNPEFNFIEDNTIIDGEFQDERYFEHRLDEISSWLQTNRSWAENESTCLIGFRGGEFYTVPELGLPKPYYEQAIAKMREINPKMKFEVETDDPILAKQFFPDFKIVHDIEENWCKMRGYRYAIVANSSFYILPRLLRHNHKYPKDYENGKNLAVTIAPLYWDRYNIRVWERPYNYYKAFTYI